MLLIHVCVFMMAIPWVAIPRWLTTLNDTQLFLHCAKSDLLKEDTDLELIYKNNAITFYSTALIYRSDILIRYIHT